MAIASKNILMFCSWFPNRVQPTNGNFAEKHIRLIARKHQVTVFQVEYDPSMSFSKASEWIETEQDNYRLLTIYFGNHLGRIARIIRRLILCWKAIVYLNKKTGKFDLFHIHVAMPGVLLGCLANRLYRLPYMLSSHSSGFLPSSPRKYSFLQRRLLMFLANKCEVICPVSEALGDALRANGLQAPIKVIPNVVDTDLFYPTKELITCPPLKLLHISNFHPEAKNVEGILRVAKKLQEKESEFKLTIAGDGDLEALKVYAKSLNVDPAFVSLQGTLKETEVAEIMRQHHLFLLFSNYETQGVTLLEAQCTGLPIIATRVGGIPEILCEEWMGEMVEVGNEEALLLAIEKAIISYSSKHKKLISDHAKGRYSEAVLETKFAEIYYEISS